MLRKKILMNKMTILYLESVFKFKIIYKLLLLDLSISNIDFKKLKKSICNFKKRNILFYVSMNLS